MCPLLTPSAHRSFQNLNVCCWRHLNVSVLCLLHGFPCGSCLTVFPVSFLAELARVCFQGAQDPAVEVETQVATTVLGMETEHKVKLSLQTELQEEINRLKIENRNLHEKLQREIRLKEDLEKVSSCESWWRGTTATSTVTCGSSCLGQKVVRMSGCTRAWPGVGWVSVSLSWSEPAPQLRPELCFLLLRPPAPRGWGAAGCLQRM